MKGELLDIEQRTPEWHLARKGVITASKLHRCFTSKLEISERGCGTLARDMAADRCGYTAPRFISDAMQRGIDMEPVALETLAYILQQDEPGYTAHYPGFYLNEELNIGASPDAMYSLDGDFVFGAEVKCPLMNNHIKYVKKEGCPPLYYPQVQMNMALTGLDKWVFCSYFPGSEVKISFVDKDPEFHEKIALVANKVTKEMNSYL